MKWNKNIIIAILFFVIISGCHKDPQLNSQQRFASDPNYRFGKWYSISDTAGNAILQVNTMLDTIWFINDTLAGWTGFKSNPHQYVFWKTYIDPKSIYNIIYLAPENPDTTKIDTIKHQFGFNGDTMTFYWDFTTQPPHTERYLKKKN